MEVIKVPSKILNQKCEPVCADDFDIWYNPELWEGVKQMKSLLFGAYDGTGKGLAAPQVGINKRFFIIRFGDKMETFFNPIVRPTTVLKVNSTEACLSIPDQWFITKRYEKVLVEWYNETGQLRRKEFTGFDAIAIQHENDHLNGVLISDIGKKSA